MKAGILKAIGTIVDLDDAKVIAVGIIVILVVGLLLILFAGMAGLAVGTFEAMRAL